jgi:hypothetical protein
VLLISVGDLHFTARLELEAAPRTVAAVRRLLPLRSKIVQARWSGEAAWIPMGDLDIDLATENATAFPGAGELLFYPGGFSETEILFPYGRTHFASTLGTLAGNHFASLVVGRERLPELGRRVLWEGAQDVQVEEERAPGALESDPSGTP